MSLYFNVLIFIDAEVHDGVRGVTERTCV